MHGTFRPGDVLLVVPAGLGEVRVGDVVVILRAQPDGTTALVAHRVRARTAAGLLTQGDCSPAPDAEVVTAESLVGRVCFLQRDGRRRRVWSGHWGMLWAAFLRLRRRFLRALEVPYRLLRRSGWVRRLWRPAVEQVYLNGPKGPAVKYVHGGRTVACRWPESGRFWCRRPYDLVLDFPPDSSETGDSV